MEEDSRKTEKQKENAQLINFSAFRTKQVERDKFSKMAEKKKKKSPETSKRRQKMGICFVFAM